MDLLSRINLAKPGETIDLRSDPPGTSYDLSDTAVITVENLTILARPDSPLTGPDGTGPWWLIEAPDFTLEGFTVANAGKWWAAKSPRSTCRKTTIKQCFQVLYTSGHSLTPHEGGIDCTFEDVSVELTQTVAFFTDRDRTTLRRCRVKRGSVGEYDVRQSNPDGITNPTGLLIEGGEFGNSANAYAKPTIGLRGSSYARITGVTIHGTVRLGQQSPKEVKPGDYCDVTIDNCKFLDQLKGNCYINVFGGTDAQISGCDFAASVGPAIASDATGTRTVVTNCTGNAPPRSVGSAAPAHAPYVPPVTPPAAQTPGKSPPAVTRPPAQSPGTSPPPPPAHPGLLAKPGPGVKESGTWIWPLAMAALILAFALIPR